MDVVVDVVVDDRDFEKRHGVDRLDNFHILEQENCNNFELDNFWLDNWCIPVMAMGNCCIHVEQCIHVLDNYGKKYLVFFSSRSLKTREKYTYFVSIEKKDTKVYKLSKTKSFLREVCFFDLVLLSLYIFWGKCVYFSISEW